MAVIVTYLPFEEMTNQPIGIPSTSRTIGKVTVLNFNSLAGHFWIKIMNVELAADVDVIVLMPRPGLT